MVLESLQFCGRGSFKPLIDIAGVKEILSLSEVGTCGDSRLLGGCELRSVGRELKAFWLVKTMLFPEKIDLDF